MNITWTQWGSHWRDLAHHTTIITMPDGRYTVTTGWGSSLIDIPSREEAFRLAEAFIKHHYGREG